MSTSPVGFTQSAPVGELGVRASAAARRALGQHGIVRRCTRWSDVASFPGLPIYAATGPRRNPRGDRYYSKVVGIGVAEDPGEAWLKAIAEAVERYCFASAHDPSSVVRASLEEVGDDALAPAAFGLFSAEQYRRMPGLALPGPADPIDWAWAWSLTRARPVLVPAALAYSSVPHRPPNNFVHGSTSTGVATHVSVEAALLAGLLEVVEREAVMVAWLHRHRPSRLSLDGAPDRLLRLVEGHFRLPGTEFHLLDLTPDSGIPTVACLALSDHPDRPAAVFGSAARLDPADAARKALLEAAQTIAGCQASGWDRSVRMTPGRVRTMEDHARLYAGSASAGRLRFLVGGPGTGAIGRLPRLSTGTARGDLDACLARLAAVGLEVLAVELTTADAADCGFRTMRVLVPGSVDFCGDVRFPRLGSPRIHSLPRAAGWRAAPLGELNLAPCPLP